MLDLADRRLGAGVVAASDESFGAKEHLLLPGPVAFVPGTYDVRGEAVPDPRLLDGLTPDLASAELGAEVVACSDGFYSPPGSLLLPDRPRHMGEGWETRRLRGPGGDVVVVRLAAAGELRRVEVDTTCFVHNASASCVLSVLGDPGAHDPGADDPRWAEVLTLRLQPDTRHLVPLRTGPVTHVRLRLHPDGGLARLRVLAALPVDERARLGLRWWDALPAEQAADVLRDVEPGLAERLVTGRPLSSAARLAEVLRDAVQADAVRDLLLGPAG